MLNSLMQHVYVAFFLKSFHCFLTLINSILQIVCSVQRSISLSLHGQGHHPSKVKVRCANGTSSCNIRFNYTIRLQGPQNMSVVSKSLDQWLPMMEQNVCHFPEQLRSPFTLRARLVAAWKTPDIDSIRGQHSHMIYQCVCPMLLVQIS